jgi:hypothetical protein
MGLCYNRAMTEVWLRTNRRALYVGMILPGTWLAAAIGSLWLSLSSGQPAVISAICFLLALPPLWLLLGLVYALTRPRIAYEPGELLVFVEMHRPTRVPIDIVECFFLGQGPSELPKLAGREPETSNVVVRLAESAVDWKHRDIRPAFGHWCEGYITIRGAWCEPIGRDLMQRLNHRLAEVHRERKATESKTEATT